jgi:hypothetical protein
MVNIQHPTISGLIIVDALIDEDDEEANQDENEDEDEDEDDDEDEDAINTPSFHPAETPTRKPSSHWLTFLPTTKTTTNTPSYRPSTRSPTSLPPTLEPTYAPSRLSTKQPSQQPTLVEPSLSPTKGPISPRSVNPTRDPSWDPSNEPTLVLQEPATWSPTDSPSLSPTETSTISLTKLQPSEFPSSGSTKQPLSGTPTNKPSLTPLTATPSVKPSTMPTSSPSLLPTEAPPNSMEYPSSKPSDIVASLGPSALPFTIRPSYSSPPTESPSTTPTFSPSIKIETESPVLSTSSPSTLFPTKLPTVAPSIIFTSSPTANRGKSTFSPTLSPVIAEAEAIFLTSTSYSLTLAISSASLIESMSTDSKVSFVFANVTCDSLKIDRKFCHCENRTFDATLSSFAVSKPILEDRAIKTNSQGKDSNIVKTFSTNTVLLEVDVSIEIPLLTFSGSTALQYADWLYERLSNAWISTVKSPSTMMETIRQGLLSTPSVQFAITDNNANDTVLTIASIDPAMTLTAYETVFMPTTSPTKSPSSKSGVIVLEWNEPVRLFDVEFGLNGLYWLLILLSITVICVAIGVILSWSYCYHNRSVKTDDIESIADDSELAMATECLPMNQLSGNEIALSGLPMATVEVWRGSMVGNDRVIEVDLDAIRIDESAKKNFYIDRDNGSIDESASAPPMMPMIEEGHRRAYCNIGPTSRFQGNVSYVSLTTQEVYL